MEVIVTNDQRVEVAADLPLLCTDLHCAACDWAERTDQAITALHAESVAVREHDLVTEDGEERVNLIRHIDRYVRIVAEVFFDVAIDQPLVALVNLVVDTRLRRVAAVIAGNAHDGELLELLFP